MAVKRASENAKSHNVFGHARKPAKMFRAGLYARVSTNDQQTLPMQTRALREYVARRGWTLANADPGGRLRSDRAIRPRATDGSGAPPRNRCRSLLEFPSDLT